MPDSVCELPEPHIARYILILHLGGQLDCQVLLFSPFHSFYLRFPDTALEETGLSEAWSARVCRFKTLMRLSYFRIRPECL